MLQNLNQASFEEETAEGIVLVKFGSEWCGPCQAVRPVLERMSQDDTGTYAGVRFFEVDTDNNPELAASFGIRGIPAFFILRDGEVIGQTAGAVSEEALASLISLAAN